MRVPYNLEDESKLAPVSGAVKMPETETIVASGDAMTAMKPTLRALVRSQSSRRAGASIPTTNVRFRLATLLPRRLQVCTENAGRQDLG